MPKHDQDLADLAGEVDIAKEARLRASWSFKCRRCGLVNEAQLKSLYCFKCGAGSWEGRWSSVDFRATQVCHTDHGLGVVATKDIPQGTLIEACPVWLIPVDDFFRNMSTLKFKAGGNGKDKDLSPVTLLYPWFDGSHKMLSAGNGLLYNHCSKWKPNLQWWYRIDRESGRYFQDFYTIRAVSKGEELLVVYADEVWFPPYHPPGTLEYSDVLPGAVRLRKRR